MSATVNELVERYRAAELAYEQARARWNALPDADARAASAIDLTALDCAATTAARALVAAHGDEHRIEERAVVYLRLGPNGWEIDPVTLDGHPLDGYTDGPLNSECECSADLDGDAAAEAEAVCEAVREAAARIVLPDGHELGLLLTGTTVVNIG